MSNKRTGQLPLFQQLGQDLDPAKAVDELQELARFLDKQTNKLRSIAEAAVSPVNRISPAQLSAESFEEFKSSGQQSTLIKLILADLMKHQPSACYEIEPRIGRAVQHTGTLVQLKKQGIIGVSETRIKVNPNTNRRVGVYYLELPFNK